MSGKNDGKIIDFREAAAKRGKPVAGKASPPAVTQVIKGGSNNAQIAGNGNEVTINISAKAAPKIIMESSPDCIGGNPMLKTAIQERFNRLGDERKKRFGDSSYPAMYNAFKKDFQIKKSPWTIIWTWPVECAESILAYLDDKFANTIQGRIEKAASRDNYLPARPQLYARERELLSCIGLEIDSPAVKAMLQQFFGVVSHTKLTHQEHWRFVQHLEGKVTSMERG